MRLRALQLSRRRPAAPEPPEKAAKPKEGDRSKKNDQRRFLDPGDRWHRKRHHHSEGADLPGQTVDARDKGSKGEEKKNRKPGRIGVQHPLNVRNEQEIHGHQESSPVKSLRPDEPDASVFVFGMRPTGKNTQHSRQNGEYLPI